VDGDGCSSACIIEFCGDGIVNNAGEECDEGEANSDTLADACRIDCKIPSCGDGVQDSGEACDDGNIVDGDGCESDCTITPDPAECGEDVDCADSISCTVDTCDTSSGVAECVNEPQDSLCNDNDPCTADVCAEGGCDYTPVSLPFAEPGVDVNVVVRNPGLSFGTPSYFDMWLTTSFFGGVVQEIAAYCIDEDITIADDTNYCGNMYSSHPVDLSLSGLPNSDRFEGGLQVFDSINWIINQDFTTLTCPVDTDGPRPYTYGDIQRAIWQIIEEENVGTPGLGGPNNWSQECADEIQAAALSEGNGFVSQCDEFVMMVVFTYECDTGTVKQALLAKLLLSQVHECCP